ncbi:unnamed protein product [Cercopithifilaria johnstoni]|uniref:Uncharacterized protein n=1 Tax=Cercopithifilaria johnstoni TaxID=2874296 RepID=A0A8J2MP93_9BILA|nr:unnamed protein product [Cercopithifilaria johnstoni]
MKSELIPSFTLLCVFSMLVMLVLSDLPQETLPVNGSNPDNNISDNSSSNGSSSDDDSSDDSSSDDSSGTIYMRNVSSNNLLYHRIVDQIMENLSDVNYWYNRWYAGENSDDNISDNDAFVER